MYTNIKQDTSRLELKNFYPSQYKSTDSHAINHNYLTEQFNDYGSIFKKIEAVVKRGDFTLGEAVDRFEGKFAELVGSKHAIGVGSGTDALFLSLRALGIGQGDEVIVPTFTFYATVGAIVASGATPVFADSRHDYNIDPGRIESLVTRRTKAILPVHWAGKVCDMSEIGAIARKFGLHIVEDACHAVLASFGNKKAGTFGDTGCFSMHPLKNLNVWGDGGIVVTNNDSINHELRLLRNHGLKSRDHCERFGYNSRLDTVQAVVAEHMLEKIEAITEKRIHNALYLDKQLGRMSGVQVPVRDLDIHRQVFHIYSLTFEKRDELKLFLESKGIDAKIHYPTPIHLQPAAKKFVENSDEYPVAEQLARSTLSLPVHEFITEQQLDFIVGAIKEFYS